MQSQSQLDQVFENFAEKKPSLVGSTPVKMTSTLRQDSDQLGLDQSVKLGSKRSTSKDTSRYNQLLQEAVQRGAFSPQAQRVIKNFELEVPERVLSLQVVQELLAQEEDLEERHGETFNYFGGVCGEDFHGMG